MCRPLNLAQLLARLGFFFVITKIRYICEAVITAISMKLKKKAKGTKRKKSFPSKKVAELAARNAEIPVVEDKVEVVNYTPKAFGKPVRPAKSTMRRWKDVISGLMPADKKVIFHNADLLVNLNEGIEGVDPEWVETGEKVSVVVELENQEYIIFSLIQKLGYNNTAGVQAAKILIDYLGEDKMLELQHLLAKIEIID